MLTRLRVNGFKNLVNFEVYFGPFTCISGENAVGKSNLFDAIRFLSLLASRRLDEAAAAIRSEVEGRGDIRSLFTRNSDGTLRPMEFDLDMIAPREASDDLGQEATASATFLRYKLKLGYRDNPEERRRDAVLELLEEELTHHKKADRSSRLNFPSSKAWLESVVEPVRRVGAYISTEEGIVTLHQDGVSRQSQGKKRGTGYRRQAKQLPKTVISAADADNPTVLCARAEMRGWEMLQLEPAAMRESDRVSRPPGIGANGAGMPSTLYELARLSRNAAGELDPEAIYQRVGNRLSELIPNVGSVRVDEDRVRDLLTILLVDTHGVETPARSLSDGTLYFLALVLKQMETTPQRLLCLEEPENGIHPDRIDAIVRLLIDTSMNTDEPSSKDHNPMRQVIINTHSPRVVQQVPAESLLIAELRAERDCVGKPLQALAVKAMSGTWRSRLDLASSAASKGALHPYLNSVARVEGRGRVIDRDEFHQMQFDLQ